MLIGIAEIVLGLLMILGLFIWLNKRKAKNSPKPKDNNLESLLKLSKEPATNNQSNTSLTNE